MYLIVTCSIFHSYKRDCGKITLIRMIEIFNLNLMNVVVAHKNQERIKILYVAILEMRN